MLEVDDVVGLYFLLPLRVFEPAVQDELPQALALVLVDDVDAPVDRLLDGGTALSVLVAGLSRLEGGGFVRTVEDDGDVGVGEVHVAVGLSVVNAETVIVVDFVADFLVGAVGDDAEVEETREFLHQF